MRSAMKWVLASVIVLSLGLGACYPESQDREIRVVLPLEDMGLSVKEQALTGWMDWLDFGDGWDTSTQFEMNELDKSFFLNMKLLVAGLEMEEELEIFGGGVTYNNNTGLLTITAAPRELTETRDCILRLGIFMYDADRLRFMAFAGESVPFRLSVAMENGLDMALDELETATVRAVYQGDAPAEAKVALRDDQYNVRFPPVGFEGSVANLAYVPVGRDLYLEYQDGPNANFEAVTALRMDLADSQLDVEISP
ncbi:MAG: hypothetical protein JRF33_22535 [Deltaproteobacteria bacterium]|nr:hypothetical protein [Deltaproteobacteria bacterium]